MSERVKKPAIGKVDKTDRATYAMKERLEQIAGERSDTVIAKLPAGATTVQIADKINEIIDLLQ